MKTRPLISIIIFLCAVIALHLVLRALDKEFCLTQLTMAIYYSIVVASLCLVMGYAGQVSMGHGAFFAIGGYTSAVLTTYDFSRFQTTAWAGWLKLLRVLVVKDDLYGGQIMTGAPWAAFLLAIVITAFIATFIGYPVLGLKGHYLAMATLGFGLIVNRILVATTVLGAADGISGVPAWVLPGGLTITGKSSERIQNYYFACGLTLVVLILLGNLVRSRVGRALQAIHEGETAANTIGINTARYKLKAFVASAILAAVAGVFFTHYTGGIGPSEASALKSVRYLALAATGGMANVWSAALVSTVINFLSLRDWFGSYDNAVFGVILIVIISIAPDGPFKPLGLFLRSLVSPSHRSHLSHLSHMSEGEERGAP